VIYRVGELLWEGEPPGEPSAIYTLIQTRLDYLDAIPQAFANVFLFTSKRRLGRRLALPESIYDVIPISLKRLLGRPSVQFHRRESIVIIDPRGFIVNNRRWISTGVRVRLAPAPVFKTGERSRKRSLVGSIPMPSRHLSKLFDNFTQFLKQPIDLLIGPHGDP
jgi:hypothetical protein